MKPVYTICQLLTNHSYMLSDWQLSDSYV